MRHETLKATPEPGSSGGNEKNGSNHTTLLIDGLAASRVLSISQRKLGQLVAVDAIPSVKIGALRRFAPAELIAWIRCGCPTAPGSAERVRAALHEGVRR